ncbi:MAG: S8 family serine peptidase [Fibrobacter sp.]|nr:S8 family serine peptidase [Fibrobacter sp.]
MNVKIAIVFLFATIVAQAKNDELDALPQYVPQSRVTKAVENFLNRTPRRTAGNVNRDVLGRLQGQYKVYTSTAEERMKVIVSDLSFRETVGSSSEGRYENDGMASRYWLNGNLLPEDVYVARTDKENEKFYRPSYVAYLTASEIKELLNGATPVLVGEYLQQKPAMAYSDIHSLSQISTHAFTNGHKGNGVGVYFNETGCPNSANLDLSNYSAMNSCIHGERIHATGVAMILQKTAPEAKIFGYDEVGYPNPNETTPRIDIGSHSWTVCSDGSYCQGDVDMDNYIYNNRVINFVCAGNKDQGDDDYWVKSPGLAVNAITVGAVTPTTGYYAYYSMWKNSDVRNQKPEVANFTDFYFPNAYRFWENDTTQFDGFLNGTSASTPYMAGMVADLLQDHVFYKRHPEVVKALLLTSNSLTIGNANRDTDNYVGVAQSVSRYSDLAWNNRSAYWNGSNSCCFDDHETITKTESGIVANHHYRIAISWLTPADYVDNYRLLAQDIDLYVYQDGNLIASSDSPRNPFEIVDFVAPTSGDLTVKIVRCLNSGTGDVVLGYNLWHNQ